MKKITIGDLNMEPRTINLIAKTTGCGLSDINKYIQSNGRYRPAMLICETINICNNNCIICAYSHMTRKKTFMSLDLFQKIVKDYSDMGGGALSLTPVVGDVLIDECLADRITIAKRYDNISTISFTTNAIAASKIASNQLSYILKNTNKVLISVYGIDALEYKTMTRSDNYENMVSGVKKIIDLVEDKTKIEIGFRLLFNRTEQEIIKWFSRLFGTVAIKYHVVTQYSNWNVLDTTVKLPFDAKWLDPQINTASCLIPIVAVQVFSNGDVSFCPCDDFDRNDEFHLGNVNSLTLSEMCNSDKYYNLIERGAVKISYCNKCTFYKPIHSLVDDLTPIKNPLEFIGG